MRTKHKLSLPSHAPEESEKKEGIKARTSPPGEVVYGAVYKEGKHELNRGSRALALSGFAAGMSMGFSFITEGLLRAHLPEAPWRILITKLGYSVGFIIVILGRQQLFTKNTLTVILPLLNERSLSHLLNVARLWSVVLLTNLIGAILFAILLAKTSLFEARFHSAFAAIATEEINPDFGPVLVKAIFAGWLIALMIWLLPFAEAARVWVIALLAYVVGLGHFSHIIAGTVSSGYLVLINELTIPNWLFDFFLPVLLGNIIGGVALVAAMAHTEFLYEGRRNAED